jgi:hypothetical protein
MYKANLTSSPERADLRLLMIPSSYIRVSEYNPQKNFYKFTPGLPFDIFCDFFSNAFYAQYIKNHDDLTVIL